MTRFRIGVAFGFAAGYYLGARAGRARYEQINRTVARVRRSRPVAKLRAAIELGRERVRSDDDRAVQLVLVEEATAEGQGSSR